MDPAYLDYAATTPVREEVRTAMEPYLTERFGNPSSVHRWGRVAAEALESARAEIADCLGARPSEVFLVRGAPSPTTWPSWGRAGLISWRGAPHDS